MLYEKIKLAILTTLVLVTAISGWQEAKRIEMIERRVNMIQQQSREEAYYNAHLIKSMVHRMEVK